MPKALRSFKQKVGGFLRVHNRTRNGVVNAPLPTPLRSSPNVAATLETIFAAPLASALIYQLFAVRNNPRFTRLPDDFQHTGFFGCLQTGEASPFNTQDLLECGDNFNQICLICHYLFYRLVSTRNFI